MINLPVEVLHLIFPQLSARDKLECMTVCRQWEQVIHQSLFRIVYIQSLDQLNKLIARLKRDPLLGAQVERLILNLESENEFDETALIDLIPNVREFTFETHDDLESHYYEPDDSDDEDPETTRDYEPRKDHPWCNRIEKIVENTPATYTRVLLWSGSCRNLTHLSLAGRNTLFATGVITLLDNTPALKLLELIIYKVALLDLELLHSLVPTLTSLILSSCHMKCTTFPSDIEPATAIKSFQSIHCSNSTAEYPYIKYIVEKYTNLEELAFKSYDIGIMETNQTEKATEIRAMMVSYMKKLSIGLKTLSLSLDIQDDEVPMGFDFDVLDESGCQIEKLKLDYIDRMYVYEQLANTTQVQYIRSLSVHRLPYSKYNHDGLILLKWLSPFTALKELSLDSHQTSYGLEKPRLNLPDFLDILAETQVEILRLADMELSFNISGTMRTYPLIKDLTLDAVDLKYNTDVAISRSLINLRRLKLDNCVKYKSSFSFPKTQLSYLEVLERYNHKNTRVLVMTIDDNQQRLYTLKGNTMVYRPEWDGFRKDPRSFASVSSEPYDGTFDGKIDNRVLSIVCQSVYNCFLIRNY